MEKVFVYSTLLAVGFHFFKNNLTIVSHAYQRVTILSHRNQKGLRGVHMWASQKVDGIQLLVVICAQHLDVLLYWLMLILE